MRTLEITQERNVLSDERSGIAIVSSGGGNGSGQIDILDSAELLLSGGGSTIDRSSSIVGIEDADFGSVLVSNRDLTGDGVVDLLVGAPRLDANASAVGGWYIYESPIRGELSVNDAWVFVEGTFGSERLGSALAIVGDSIWAGAPGSDQFVVNGGAVKIFSKTGEMTGEIYGEEPSMNFGGDLSTPKDLNGDGIEDIVVGAYGANNNKGAAFVFLSAGNIQSMVAGDAEISWNGVVSSGEFGRQVEMVGDITNDGYVDIAVSATNSSKVYIIDGSELGDYLADSAEFIVSGATNAALGTKIVYAGDLNGDRIDDLLLGDYISSEVSIVYGPVVSDINANNIVTLNRGSDQLGWSIASGEDLNGDGVSDMVLGARITSDNANKNGAVFILEGVGL